MKKAVLGILALFVLALPGQAQVLQDGFEGPYVQPETVFDFDFWGEGFDEDWFVTKVPWVGDNQFWFYAEPLIKTEGENAQAANGNNADGNPRDLWLGRYVDGLEPNTAYRVQLDYRFDLGDPGEFSNGIQWDIRDGDRRTDDDIADIEDYPGHERPETTRVDPATFGDESFHTLDTVHVTGDDATGFTMMMIIRFVTTTDPEQDNWLFLDNFRVTVAEDTGVADWTLY